MRARVFRGDYPGVAKENFITSYRGQLYIDLPYDTNDLAYQQLAGFLENPDGTMKLPGVNFCYLPFGLAMKNAHHDEPGFWERQLEDF